MDNEKEISFGAFDSELMHQEIFIPEGFEATIDGNKIILTRIENEDERVRKALITYFQGFPYNGIEKAGTNPKEAIAWLKKQGNQKSKKVSIWKHWKDGICGNGEGKLIYLIKNGDAYSLSSSLGFECDYIDLSELDNLMLEKQGEQKFPIEKFHEGEWVVFNDKHESVYQIEKIENFQYTLRHILGGSMPLSFSGEDMIRPWAIQDAKDGDVLACNEEILLFKSYSVQGRISLYCWYNGQTNNFHSKEVVDTLMTTRNKIYPATKEQRDLLFTKMKEAGYEWDSVKKELKKIEQSPAWSEEDKKMLNEIVDIITGFNAYTGTILVAYDKHIRQIEWFKSLKDRYTWKPSDEQIDALADALSLAKNCGEEMAFDLRTLLEQLRKLKGE